MREFHDKQAGIDVVIDCKDDRTESLIEGMLHTMAAYVKSGDTAKFVRLMQDINSNKIKELTG